MNEERPSVSVHLDFGRGTQGEENSDIFKRLQAMPVTSFVYDWVSYTDIVDEDDDERRVRYRANMQINPLGNDDVVLDELVPLLEHECVYNWSLNGLRESVSYTPRMTAAAALAQVGAYGDGLGYRMDEGIISPAAALARFGVRTTASCEGHTDRAWPLPWIDIKTMSLPQLNAMALTLPGWGVHTFGDPGYLPANVRFCPTAAFEDVNIGDEAFTGELRGDVSEAELLAWREQLAEWAQDWLEV